MCEIIEVMDIAKDIEVVERELLEAIIDHLKNNKIDVGEARKLAQDFLATLPIQNRSELLAKLKALGETYDEAHAVYVKEFSKDSVTKTSETLDKMRDAIATGNMDNAIAHAKSLQGGA